MGCLGISSDVLLAIKFGLPTTKKPLRSLIISYRQIFHDMTPPEKSLLPKWRAFAARRPGYAPLDDISGSDAIEIPQLSRSVFLALEMMFENSIDFGLIFNPQSNIPLSNMSRSFEPRPQ